MQQRLETISRIFKLKMTLFRKIGDFFLKSKWRLVLLIPAVLLVVFYLLPKEEKPSDSSKVLTPTRALTFQEQTLLNQSKNQFINQLPIDTEEYLIEYLPSQDYFFVQIRKNPYQQYKQQIESLFKQNGIDPGYVNIEWGSVRGAGPRQ